MTRFKPPTSHLLLLPLFFTEHDVLGRDPPPSPFAALLGRAALFGRAALRGRCELAGR